MAEPVSCSSLTGNVAVPSPGPRDSGYSPGASCYPRSTQEEADQSTVLMAGEQAPIAPPRQLYPYAPSPDMQHAARLRIRETSYLATPGVTPKRCPVERSRSRR